MDENEILEDQSFNHNSNKEVLSEFDLSYRRIRKMQNRKWALEYSQKAN